MSIWEAENRFHIVFKAILCSFGAYAHMPPLRGAIFCLFPGLVLRSRYMLLVGFVGGAIAELLWGLLGAGNLDQRAPYNTSVVNWLPGVEVFVRPGAGSNDVPFVLGFTFWCLYMFLVWCYLLQTSLTRIRTVVFLVTGSLLASALAWITWAALPYDAVWLQPVSMQSCVPFALGTLLIVSLFPFLCSITGLLIFHLADTSERERPEASHTPPSSDG